MANAGRGRPEYLPDPEEAYEHERERWEREHEIELCCQGRNINCGHHYGRS